jgi:type IV secretory pathway VirB2 component (pilin)
VKAFGPRTVLPGDSITVLAGGTATTVGCALVIVLGWIAIFGARNR